MVAALFARDATCDDVWGCASLCVDARACSTVHSQTLLQSSGIDVARVPAVADALEVCTGHGDTFEVSSGTLERALQVWHWALGVGRGRIPWAGTVRSGHTRFGTQTWAPKAA
jgi:hypothetical protein